MQHDAATAVRQLVRGQLGCACPDPVFERTRVLDARRHFAGLPGDSLFAIDDRLLLLVVSSSPWQAVLADIEQLFRRGRELRDSEGMNRFRLVVAVPQPRAARLTLEPRFSVLPERDERMHLHVIPAQALVASLRAHPE